LISRAQHLFISRILAANIAQQTNRKSKDLVSTIAKDYMKKSEDIKQKIGIFMKEAQGYKKILFLLYI